MISGLIECAIYDGINYWSTMIRCENPERCQSNSQVPMNGGALVYSEFDERTGDLTGDELVLDREACLRGLKVMAEKYPFHFANVLNGNFDSETGDVYVQCCLLSVIKYG